MPKLTVDKLNRIYEEAEQADREVFAEMRSNVLLIAGEHYNRKGAQRTYNRLRSNTELNENQKLRLTKNHIHKAVRSYVTNILTYAPGIMAAPRHDNDMQDKKSADLNQAVWLDAKSRYRIKEKIRGWCRNFCGIGEVATKIFWDPSAGEFLGYQQSIHPDTGEPLADETGQPLPDESRPVFRGGFIFEPVYGFNLLRHSAAKDMHSAACWIVRKLVDTEVLRSKYQDDPKKVRGIQEASKEDFIVFDSDKASYQRTRGQSLVKEYYWPVSEDYPQGYFAISTADVILDEGPLPGGLFPIIWQGFDEYPTTPRGRSLVKLARPYQAEINRAASSIAMHQITVGDDKILYQAGTKLQPGALLPGVRGISYAGAAPTVLPGRDGGQYLPYVGNQIAELYQILMLDEENQPKDAGNTDPFAQLFKSLKQQKKFAEYGEKFEQFLVDVGELFLKLAKLYYPDDMLILAVGTKERINISEFRATDPLSTKIKLEPRDETIETLFGRQLTLNHILQYASNALGKDDIGKIIRQMPYANAEEAFGDLTIDYDCVTNDMLQMERGLQPQFGQYDDHKYAVKRLTKRTREPDFSFLPQPVQQLYRMHIQQHEQAISQEMAAVAAAKNQFIPSNGAMIATDMYVTNPKDPAKPAKRVRIPYEAINWLVERLESQGQSLDAMEQQNQGVLTEIAGMLTGGKHPTMQQPSQQQALPGGTSAIGVSG